MQIYKRFLLIAQLVVLEYAGLKTNLLGYFNVIIYFLANVYTLNLLSIVSFTIKFCSNRYHSYVNQNKLAIEIPSVQLVNLELYSSLF